MAYSFGRRQIGKPTPASIGFKIAIISIVGPVIQLWMQSDASNFLPAKVCSIIISILALIIALSNALKPLFGVTVDNDSVPTEEVKEVEDKPEIKP